MKRKLNLNETILIGLLLFGLFFGAGNLIFPLELGESSGYNLTPVTLGFLISAVGLPILAVVANALSDSDSLYELAKPTGKFFASFFTILLYLTIGPGFAIPRTATVSYEVIISGVSNINTKIGLFIFSLVFFALVLFFSSKRANLINTIGKYMTPLFLILLSILVIFSIINPMGPLGDGLPSDKYLVSPFTTGIIDGYNTLDAPAGLAFAIIIITSIKDYGIKDPKSIAIETFKSGLICLILMSLVYASLSMMGSSSRAIMDDPQNGAVILGRISSHYLGRLGHILLSLIVFVACLKTAIGLVSACSEMFSELLKFKIDYKIYCVIFSVISFLIANLGLKQIISLSLPVLMFLYPLSIVLIILSFIQIFTGKREIIYKMTILFTLIPAIFDFLNALPEEIKNLSFIKEILNIASNYLPGYSLGFGRIIPSLIGFLIGFILSRRSEKS